MVRWLVLYYCFIYYVSSIPIFHFDFIFLTFYLYHLLYFNLLSQGMVPRIAAASIPTASIPITPAAYVAISSVPNVAAASVANTAAPSVAAASPFQQLIEPPHLCLQQLLLPFLIRPSSPFRLHLIQMLPRLSPSLHWIQKKQENSSMLLTIRVFPWLIFFDSFK
jgi:hypothetical protein